MAGPHPKRRQAVSTRDRQPCEEFAQVVTCLGEDRIGGQGGPSCAVRRSAPSPLAIVLAFIPAHHEEVGLIWH
jgi:hypothetical protein